MKDGRMNKVSESGGVPKVASKFQKPVPKEFVIRLMTMLTHKIMFTSKVVLAQIM